MSTIKQFILVEYNNIPYPSGYQSEIKEVAGHFDKNSIETAGAYSLHTEYSYGKRNFDSELIARFPILKEANKDGVPQLWKSSAWASDFADFVIALTSSCPPPRTVEIHPPFDDYCTLDQFAARFQVFEKKLHSIYPNTAIVIENRAGSIYHGGHFLFGKASEIAQLCDTIRRNNLKLGVVLDFPQLLTAEKINTLQFSEARYFSAIEAIAQHQDLIEGIHLWGKKKSSSGRWVAHAGTLDTYFGGDKDAKASFLEGIYRLCNDGKARFLVPEVNSGAEDLSAIISDLFEGIDF